MTSVCKEKCEIQTHHYQISAIMLIGRKRVLQFESWAQPILRRFQYHTCLPLCNWQSNLQISYIDRRSSWVSVLSASWYNPGRHPRICHAVWSMWTHHVASVIKDSNVQWRIRCYGKLPVGTKNVDHINEASATASNLHFTYPSASTDSLQGQSRPNL